MSKINDIKEIPEGTFSIHFKLIKKYQRLEPSIINKNITGTYQKGSFCGGSNIDLKLITFKNKICIMSELQSYVFHW